MSNAGRSKDEARRLYRQRVRASHQRADEAFRGKYQEEIAALYGLSRAEIAAVIPDITGLQVYDRLIAVVKEASRINLAQAELKARILELGDTAASIAGKVPGLKNILS